MGDVEAIKLTYNGRVGRSESHTDNALYIPDLRILIRNGSTHPAERVLIGDKAQEVYERLSRESSTHSQEVAFSTRVVDWAQRYWETYNIPEEVREILN